LRDCPAPLPVHAALFKDPAMTSPTLSPARLPILCELRPRWPALATMALLLVAPVLSGCWKDSGSSPTASTSSASDPVIARVNGSEIRQSDLALAEDDLGSDLQGAPAELKREHILSYLTDIVLVAQAAEAKKLQDQEDFKRKQAFLQKKLLMSAMLQSHGKTAATDSAMHELYDQQVKPIGAQEEVRARHILVETEDEAKAIVDQIKNGADFATLAKEKSKDPGAADGGDLGYFGKDQMVPEFSEVVFKMYPGQVSNPVKTQFGWHIIKVEDRRNKQVPEFDKIKDQIEAYVARKAQTELVTQLREKAKIERLDKPAAAPDAAAPAAPAKK
jgi:peptidyl-prolyl cis-trans isomerase C